MQERSVDWGRRPGSFSLVIVAGVFLIALAWIFLRTDTQIVQSAPPDTPATPEIGRRPAAVLVAPRDPALAELRRDLRHEVPEWRSGKWSALVVSLDRGDTLFSVLPDEPLVPASNMKLITTAAALHHLGRDYRFQTFLMSDGRIVGDELQGDLVLYGTGDPGLSERFHGRRESVFEALADSLLQLGIRSVNGDLVGDGSYFRGPLLGPAWDPADLNEWFAAPVSALSFNENVVTIQISPAAVSGGLPVVTEDPSGGGFLYRNSARTVQRRPRPRLWLERLAPMDSIRLEGEVNLSDRPIWRRLTVADPVLFSARGFAAVLEEKGIVVRGRVRAVEDGRRSLIAGPTLWAPRRSETTLESLAVHESPPLSEYLSVVNHVSHNLFAEAILKTLGRVVRGEGSFEEGARVVERFLREEVGVQPGVTEVFDGSGLSSQNIASAGAFVDLLLYMAGSEDWDSFVSSLPEAGRRSGLRRLYRTTAAGNLRAKTGTIEGVSALTGIVESKTGERILFSILANGVRSTSAAKRVEDRIAVRLAELDRPLLSAGAGAPGGD
jgi:D-alanyl-D-alanine carboxypeptidase/D-alanyl-D-alanine-endopeptidase (penicillin-binding protein 4)